MRHSFCSARSLASTAASSERYVPSWCVVPPRVIVDLHFSLPGLLDTPGTDPHTFRPTRFSIFSLLVDQSKVSYPVIGFDSIDVVNFKRGPLVVRNSPSQPVRRVASPKNLHPIVPNRIRSPTEKPVFTPPAGSNEPSKQTCFRVVAKYTANLVRGYNLVSHFVVLSRYRLENPEVLLHCRGFCIVSPFGLTR